MKETREETYRKVYIKSEADLPKEGEEWYYGHTTDTNEIVRLRDTRRSDWQCIDWYLQPQEQEKVVGVNYFAEDLIKEERQEEALVEQEKAQTAEDECTVEEEKILILFAKYSNCLGKSPIKLPCMTRSAFVAAVKEYASQSQSSVLPNEEEITNAFCDTRDEDIKNKLQYRDRDYFQAGYDFAMSSQKHIPTDEEIEKQADWFIEHIYAGYASRALRSAMIDMGKWIKEQIK